MLTRFDQSTYRQQNIQKDIQKVHRHALHYARGIVQLLLHHNMYNIFLYYYYYNRCLALNMTHDGE